MPTILCHRGRTVTADDLETIRALLMAHSEASRRAFSQRLCEHWDWRQANGALRDMVCRSLLLALHRAGHIVLPAVRACPPNNAIARRPTPLRGTNAAPDPCSTISTWHRKRSVSSNSQLTRPRGGFFAPALRFLAGPSHWLSLPRLWTKKTLSELLTTAFSTAKLLLTVRTVHHPVPFLVAWNLAISPSATQG